MARVEYNADLDPNHQILEGIKSTLRGSHNNRARTTLKAVAKIDLEDVAEQSLDQKIEHICNALQCTAEQIGDEVIFTLK